MELKVYQDGGVEPPSRAHVGDAGLDLRANEECSIAPGHIHKVRTGTYVEIPHGHVGIQAGRSGEGSKGHNLVLGIGVVDENYRGEILSPMINNSDEDWHVHRGDRISQLVIVPVVYPEVVLVDSPADLSETERGADGYGSSGVR